MKKILIILSLLLCNILLANAQSSISTDQIIEIAKQEMVTQGGHLDRLQETLVSYLDEYDCWSVMFIAKPNADGSYSFGSDVVVIVSKDGSKAKILPNY